MGTTYHIKVVTPFIKNPSDLKHQIENRLKDINQSMSTYIETSEISRFNKSTDTTKQHVISDDFLNVMKMGQKLYLLTGGAWDGTIKPLVDLWGFGAIEKSRRIPDLQKIYKMLKTLGFNQIYITKEGFLQKKIPLITVDLASIAKGYAVDQVSDVIKNHHFKDFIVEIGGEVYASGFRKDKKPWRVGINTPRPGAAYDLVYQAITLTDKAMATSGDYRNFFEVNGIRYSHILDPRTGKPVANGVVSVSVISDTCVFADGLATALVVMGAEKAVALVNRTDNTECLVIVQNPDGSFTNHYSNHFPRS